jgi:hypothetical protein
MSSSTATATATARLRLDQAAVHAAGLVQHFAYSVDDPYSTTTETNPWKRPDRIFQALRAARDDLLQAWKELEEQEQEQEQTSTSTTKKKTNESARLLDPDQCRVLYMGMITDAFADTLETMRSDKSTEGINVDVLVDCLQSGLDLLTNDEQQELLWDDNGDNGAHDSDAMDDDDEEEELLTPHELNRRKLGLDVVLSPV